MIGRPMTIRTVRRGTYALAVIAAVAATVITAGFALSGGSPGRAFPSLVPAAAASWPHLTLPDGTAVLSYPPSLRRIAGDTDAVSAGQVSAGGMIQLYLNATPRQGTERPQQWAAFRLRLLRADDAASAHQVAAAEGVKFRGGTGSCVIDTYVTRIGGHRYEEIACLVQGHASASVIVAAAPAAMWATESPLLSRAVAAYLVR
jgi:hypothetical protein